MVTIVLIVQSLFDGPKISIYLAIQFECLHRTKRKDKKAI